MRATRSVRGPEQSLPWRDIVTMRRFLATLAGILGVFVAALTQHPVQAQEQEHLPIHVIHDQVGGSVVTILTCGPLKCDGVGSGVVVSADGDRALVATNAHVMRELDNAHVRFADGTTYTVEGIVMATARVDVVLLRIAASSLQSVEIANLESLKIGHEVVVIGSPQTGVPDGGIDVVSAAILNRCVVVRTPFSGENTRYRNHRRDGCPQEQRRGRIQPAGSTHRAGDHKLGGSRRRN